jgi:hypothetical protein
MNDPLDGPVTCMACPVEVRGLFAVAANACKAFEAAVDGVGDVERFKRQMAELRREVDLFQLIVDRHFADPRHSHGGTLVRQVIIEGEQ